MNITTERVGGSILFTVEDCHHQITFMVDLAEATRLATGVLSQACVGNAGLDLPEDLRPGAA